MEDQHGWNHPSQLNGCSHGTVSEGTFINEKEDNKLLDPLLFACMLGGILGARLGHVIFYQSELFSQDFFSVFLPFSFFDAEGNSHFEFTGFAEAEIQSGC